MARTAPTTEVENAPLPKDLADKVMALIKEDKLAATLAQAYAYAKTKVSADPKHISAPFHTTSSIKEKMDGNADGSIVASATLLNFSLEVDAVSTYDVARIQWMLTSHHDARSFKDAIGPITVNYNSVNENCQGGARLDKDAEVQALCLLILWTEGATPFVEMAADLVVKFVHAGTGSASKAYALRLINKEEDKRKVRDKSIMWLRMYPLNCGKGGNIRKEVL